MVLSDNEKRNYIRRLLLSRMRILSKHGFYGILLMHMEFGLDESCDTAATNGTKIIFGPAFLDSLNDRELDFIMMHEILHVVLRHCTRREERDGDNFNIACDIVVNSTILKSNDMDLSSITLRSHGESMHLTPEGKEGFNYSAEEVYNMLSIPGNGKGQGGNNQTGQNGNKNGNSSNKGRSGKNSRNSRNSQQSRNESKSDNGSSAGNSQRDQSCQNSQDNSSGWDDHSRWGTGGDENELNELWKKRFLDACKAIEVRDPSNECGLLPLAAERLLKELRNPKLDWRTILNDFIQEEIVDYSFMPPDRRFGESPFFLPDFNDTDITVKDMLFMIDTSASMSDKEITEAYSEIKGALDQFNGKLTGWLGFFDAAVVEPQPFENIDEFEIIRPKGGGGTSFHPIFSYVRNHMAEKLPAGIIILTDGYVTDFPAEDASMGIPVLWLINNDDVTPPWGKIARLS